jgi:hypothetical protein
VFEVFMKRVGRGALIISDRHTYLRYLLGSIEAHGRLAGTDLNGAYKYYGPDHLLSSTSTSSRRESRPL